MILRRVVTALLAGFLLLVPIQQMHTALGSVPAAPKRDAVLKAAEVTTAIFPERVFYRGQVADVQMRNTGGVRFSDNLLVLAGLVDVSGYATNVKEKYQGYLLSEVHLQVNEKSLQPGAYGIGFVNGSKFIVSDVGGNAVLEIAGERDANLKRPVPLQVLPSPEREGYRLYLGRNFVSLKRPG